MLANLMISSRIDYCNSLLYGVSKCNALCIIVFRLDMTMLPPTKSYTSFPFHTASCLNTISLHSLNSPYLHGIVFHQNQYTYSWKSAISFLNLCQEGHW